MPLHTESPRPDELALEPIVLHVGDHVSVFYHGEAERDAFLIPLIDRALKADFGVICVCDRNEPDQFAKQLGAARVDVESALERGQIRLASSREAYLAVTGRFEPVETVKYYCQAGETSQQKGYTNFCVIGEMSWTLRGFPGAERLIEYEALYSKDFDSSRTVAVCLYDLEHARGEQIFDLFRLHTRIVLNGLEIPNPNVGPAFLVDRAGVSLVGETG